MPPTATTTKTTTTTTSTSSPPPPGGIPDETLRRILDQIQLTLSTSTRQLSLVRAQKAAKEREAKGVELTRQGIREEVAGGGARTWRGVGKMFMLDDPTSIDDTLASQQKSIQEEVDNLAKKQKFLEKQVTDAQGHIKDFFRGFRGVSASPAVAVAEGAKAGGPDGLPRT